MRVHWVSTFFLAVLLRPVVQWASFCEPQEREYRLLEDPSQVWWAAKFDRVLHLEYAAPQSASSLITLVLPLSHERSYLMELQCQYWPGAISLALNIPLFNGSVVFSGAPSDRPEHSLAVILQWLVKKHAELSSGGCLLELGVFAEHILELTDWYSYPVNAMRNAALSMASTDVVVLFDGDFLVGPRHVWERIQNDKHEYNAVVGQLHNNQLLVVPAFEARAETLTEQWRIASAVLKGDKSLVVDMLDKGAVIPFQYLFHKGTDYKRWRTAVTSYDQTRAHEQPGDWEPYFMALRENLPPWDERFRGYYENKISYCHYLYRMRFKFLVHPDVYALHYPHPSVLDVLDQKSGPLRKQLEHFFHKEMMPLITDKRYTPLAYNYIKSTKKTHTRMHKRTHGNGK